MQWYWIVLIAAAVIFLLLLLSLIPNRKAGERMKPFAAWRFAHRGLYDNDAGVPENSLTAFRRAVDGGYGIELDLHLTTDGKLVVFHDDVLDRVCGVSGRPDSMSYEELQKLSLLGTGEKIPLFSELLEIVDGKIPMIVEVKFQKNYADLCTAMMEMLKDYKGLYCVESFHPAVVRWMLENHPEIPRGLLSSRYEPADAENGKVSFGMRLAQELMVNFLIRPDFVAYEHTAAPTVWGFKTARRLWHVPTVAWTVRSFEEEEAARRWFDVIIFEHYIPEPRV